MTAILLAGWLILAALFARLVVVIHHTAVVGLGVDLTNERPDPTGARRGDS